MNSYSLSSKDIDKKWLLLDAENAVLGRLASVAAVLLRGKHKPTYTPNLDNGDYVVIINAEKVKLTGKKLAKKIFYHHSGYVGHLKEIPYDRLLQRKPEFVIRKAIGGMLPKGRLGRAQIKKLKVYRGPNHVHTAQEPKAVSL